eukprot:860074-Pleurochrysis_carterae.AAC.1
MLYAPGEVKLRPRLMPTHARGSMRVLLYATRGFTAKARQPNGRIGMMRGLVPVSDSYDERLPRGGP